MALNRLRFHNILVQDMGAPSEAATELAEVVDEAADGLATKSDLEQLRLELIAEMQSRFNSHLRWIMVMWGSTIAAIVALAVAVILRGS